MAKAPFIWCEGVPNQINEIIINSCMHIEYT